MNKRNYLSRRKFLCQTAAFGATMPFFALVAACDSKQSGGEAPSAGGGAGGGEAPAADGPICDLAKLSDADKAPRTALGYVEKTPDPAKTCENCNLYIADNGGCAGCTLFKGPVEPAGYCNSWAAKA